MHHISFPWAGPPEFISILVLIELAYRISKFFMPIEIPRMKSFQRGLVPEEEEKHSGAFQHMVVVIEKDLDFFGA